MRWDQGRAIIERMLRDRELERVAPSRAHADRLMAQARQHLGGAARECDHDPVLAYSALYDAARMALTAVLENQGLRPTAKGGHIAPYEAVVAQLHPPAGPKLRPYDQMRRTRHRAEYPNFSGPEVASGDVREDLPAAECIVQICASVLDDMSPF